MVLTTQFGEIDSGTRRPASEPISTGGVPAPLGVLTVASSRPADRCRLVETMNADAGLGQLLSLRPVAAHEEQVGPGRQGGLAVAVLGGVIAAIGVLLGLAQPNAAWSGVALAGLGTVEIVIGVVLMPLGRLDRQRRVRVAPDDTVPTEQCGHVTAARC
jgi:hypothetical protein